MSITETTATTSAGTQIEVVELDAALPLSESMARVVLGGVASDASDALDFERTMVLVPAGRMARAVERRLLAAASVAGKPLIAPSLVTPAMFLKRFLRPKRVVLGDIGARLAWREAVAAFAARGDGERRQLEAAFGPVRTAADEAEGRALSAASLDAVARRLHALARDAAGARHGFASIRDHAALTDAVLRRRWQMFADIERVRDALLEAAGVCDRDATQRDAVLAACGCDSDDRGRGAAPASIESGAFDRIVVMLADPEPVQRALLALLAARGVTVEVCVHTRTNVDPEGFPRAAEWSARRFGLADIADSAIGVADGPDEVAEAAVEAVAAIPEPRTADHIALVAPGEEQCAALARALSLRGVCVASDGRRAASTTRLGLLLERLAALFGPDARGPAPEALAEFVRHPDVAAWLVREGRSCAGADAAVAAYRSATLAADWRERPPAEAEGRTPYETVRSRVQELVQPLEAPRAASAWAAPIRDALAKVIADDRSGRDGERVESVGLLDRVLGELHRVPKEFALPITAREALSMVARELGRLEVTGERTHGVEPIGWLDAGVADEPHLVFCGFNDGCVPEGAVVDPLLPDATRAALGMMSSQRRVARDAWILDSILARRKGRGSVRFIAARRSAEGDPLKPSRFLLQVDGVADGVAEGAGQGDVAGTGEALARRVLALFGELPARVGEEHGGGNAGTATTTSAFPIKPKPVVPLAPFSGISVTQFKQYLKCPYLFLLSHHERLGLSAQDEDAAELDALGFGLLAHAALERWGRIEAQRDEPTTDESVVLDEVLRHFDAVVEERYPSQVRAAVRVQFELLRRRLARFAKIQAAEAAQGWHVRFVELAFDDRSHDRHPDEASAQASPLAAPKLFAEPSPGRPEGGSLSLRGRIDRVDQNRDTGAWRALDYKTFSKDKTPAGEHWASRAGKWKDLQLPLYRFLLRSIGGNDLARLGLEGPIAVDASGLGYVVLGTTDVGTRFVFLSEAAKPLDLDAAEREASRIVGAILDGCFDPAERAPVKAGDALAPVWGLGLRAVDDDAASGESPDGDSDDAGGDE
ncbi:MAG: PD-(D/E)XK nuclease family protein [Planctomycetota bacterium]